MYNPSAVGIRGDLFGFPYSHEESDLVIIPVGHDVTVSYSDGTAYAPKRICEESSQLDLSLASIVDPWKFRLSLLSPLIDNEQNFYYRQKAKAIIDGLEKGQELGEWKNELKEVNDYCLEAQRLIQKKCTEEFEKGKLIGLLGGDHSSPLGLINALAKRGSFGILQIDAHMDLRQGYEGFIQSHASIMFNALQIENVHSLTQVGIRDFCQEEEEYIKGSKKPINVFYDEHIARTTIEGGTWADTVADVIKTLPDQVYISFDIDGLHPSLCPNTGTPVPGGLQFNSVCYLLEILVRSGKKIVGFDLCEVGNAQWDANVGARILYRLTSLTGVSNGFLEWKD